MPLPHKSFLRKAKIFIQMIPETRVSYFKGRARFGATRVGCKKRDGSSISAKNSVWKGGGGPAFEAIPPGQPRWGGGRNPRKIASPWLLRPVRLVPKRPGYRFDLLREG